MDAFAIDNGTYSLQAASISYEMFNRWIAYIDVKPRSIDTYTKAVRQFIRWLHENAINQPSRGDILSYRRYLEATTKPTTTQTYIIAIRQFFKWLEQEGIYRNVADNVKGAKIDRQHKKDYLTTGQTQAILSGVEQHTEQGLRDYALLSIMVTGGLRTIEVSRANIEDLRTIGNSPVLFIQGKGKDEKTEYVKLPQPVENAIRTYLAERGKQDPTAPLFTSTSNNNRGKRMTTRSISGIVKSRLRAAGYDSDRLTAHSLRHTAVTLSLMGGRSLQDVQQFARHANIATTQIYAHNIDRAKNKCEETIANAIFKEATKK